MRISLTAVEDFGFAYATYTIRNDVVLHKIKQTEYSRKTSHFFFLRAKFSTYRSYTGYADPTRG